MPLPVILPRNTALEALLACQPAQCELCGEKMQRALLSGHRDDDREARRVSCKGTGREAACPEEGIAGDMPEERCPECRFDVLEQRLQDKNNPIATAQAGLRELQEEWSQVAWSGPGPACACSCLCNQHVTITLPCCVFQLLQGFQLHFPQPCRLYVKGHQGCMLRSSPCIQLC